jgi:MFS family permease
VNRSVVQFIFPFNCRVLKSTTGVGVLLPFTTIHMKSLGLSFQEVGSIYGVSSIAAILSPFLIGLIADKLGNFKVTINLIYRDFYSHFFLLIRF